MKLQGFFAIFFGLVFIASTYLIVDDSILFGGGNHDESRAVIGTVDYVENDVRTKDAGGFSWMPAKKSGSLYQADRIFTGAGSSVSLKLNNATLHLGENSLVTLSMEGNSLTLDLTMGSFAGKIAANKNVVLISNGKKKKIISKTKSKIKVTLNDNGKNTFAVLDGEVELEVDKKKAVLKRDMQASFSTNLADFKVAPRAIELVTPIKDAKVWKGKGVDLQFHWAKVGKKKKYKLELSSDSAFKKTTRVINTTELKTALGGIVPGEYFWRVSSDKNISNVRSFKYLTPRAPKVIAPQNNHVFLIQQRIPLVTLKWRDLNGMDLFRVQVASDKNYSDIIYDEKLSQPSILLDKLEKGLYYWRVQSVLDKKSPGPWSIKSMFAIYDGRRPRYLDPETDYTEELDNYKVKVGFSWQKEGAGLSYLFEISKDKGFKTKLLSQYVKTSSMNYEFTSIGNFYWRVSKVIPSGKKISTSISNVLKISMPLLEAPVLTERSIKYVLKKYRVDPGKNVDSVKDALALEWEEAEGAVAYSVKIFNEKGRVIGTMRTTKRIFLWEKLDLGTYKWNVNSIDKFNRIGPSGKDGTIKIMEEKECQNKFLFFCY